MCNFCEKNGDKLLNSCDRFVNKKLIHFDNFYSLGKKTILSIISPTINTQQYFYNLSLLKNYFSTTSTSPIITINLIYN